MIPPVIVERRRLTEERVTLLRDELAKEAAPEIVGAAACVYATGSVGRGEMSARSDLDIFIVRDKSVALPLTNLDEIRLKARLIEVSRRLGFPDFSEDGEYVKSYDVKKDLIEKLGSREDDYTNVLTARLLLLLESRPILGEPIYNRAIDELVGRYWRDFPQNAGNFLPVFLINDILRFWKTMCLNYEERTSEARTGKRRLLNYKLKYSRLLTCYSAVIYLTAEARMHQSVTPEAARAMVASTPIARLEHVATSVPEAQECVGKILANYSGFLETCDADKKDLEEKFGDNAFKRERFAEAKEFGNEVFRLLFLVGEKTELFRYLVV
jgi:predicted nucleotidyltransferase